MKRPWTTGGGGGAVAPNEEKKVFSNHPNFRSITCLISVSATIRGPDHGIKSAVPP